MDAVKVAGMGAVEEGMAVVATPGRLDDGVDVACVVGIVVVGGCGAAVLLSWDDGVKKGGVEEGTWLFADCDWGYMCVYECMTRINYQLW